MHVRQCKSCRAWLALPIDQLEVDESYQSFSLCANNLNVANDAAERSVKEISDFANYSQNAARRDDSIAVINRLRELIDFLHVTMDDIAGMNKHNHTLCFDNDQPYSLYSHSSPMS